MLKAIETAYNGYLFRSRQEARWAVFFDRLGMPYRYEVEGYDLGKLWYLPDFRLPEAELWWEVKGKPPTGEELQKAFSLARQSDQIVVVTWANFSFETQHDNIYYWKGKSGKLHRAEGFAFDGFHGYPYSDSDLSNAFTSARQARFERGRQHGKPADPELVSAPQPVY